MAAKRKRKEVRPCDVTVYTEFSSDNEQRYYVEPDAGGAWYVTVTRDYCGHYASLLGEFNRVMYDAGGDGYITCSAIKQLAQKYMEEANGYDGYQA